MILRISLIAVSLVGVFLLALSENFFLRPAVEDSNARVHVDGGDAPGADDQLARLKALQLSRLVSEGDIHDCEALAVFADEWSETAGEDLSLFLACFNQFIPRAKANYPLGVPLGLGGVLQPIKLEGSASGYQPKFRKGFGPKSVKGNGHDQAHHFAPYLILGAQLPREVVESFLWFAEKPETWGDINLAKKAIEYGHKLDQAQLRTSELGRGIRGDLCQ